MDLETFFRIMNPGIASGREQYTGPGFGNPGQAQPIPPDLLAALGMFQSQGPSGTPSFTNYDPSTGGMPTPRSQVPYDRPVTAQNLQPYPQVQNLQQLMAMTAAMHKSGVPQSAQTQILPRVTGGAITDPNATAMAERQREFGIKEADVAATREATKQQREAVQAQQVESEKRYKLALALKTIEQIEAERHNMQQYFQFLPSDQQELAVKGYNSKVTTAEATLKELGLTGKLEVPPQIKAQPGGWFGLGMFGAKELVPQAPATPQQPQALGKQSQATKGTMRIKNLKTGKQAEGPEGAVPEGWVRTR